ncbi:cytochrome P450 [Dentipellis sp. KUC8613]|nr:cytochrome P450 [Dentipellis sp. KUC8613]
MSIQLGMPELRGVLVPALKALSLAAAGLSAVVTTSIAYKLFCRLARIYTSPLRFLPGPESRSWLSGSFDTASNLEPIAQLEGEECIETYGDTFSYRGFLNSFEVFTADTKALQYILSNQTKYPKPDELNYTLGGIAGDGLLVVEGAKHRQQRRVMNPAFGPAQIRELTETMVEKSIELRDVLLDRVKGDGSPPQVKVDVYPWLNKVTLDIIGLAGFDYSFDALHASEDHPNELNAAVAKVFSFDPESLIMHLQLFFPILRHLPTASQRERARAMTTMRRIGNGLIAQKKAAVLAEHRDAKTVGKEHVQGRDLLSLLIRANMATDLPESYRMEDKDVLSQVPTFLVAGHETTSTGTTWALYALACFSRVQTKLRDEVLSHPSDNPTMDEVNSLPYLDAVVRESLRLYPPVPATSRVAAEDDVIPLEEPVTGRDGVTRKEFRISKGDWLTIPIRHINKSTKLWGDDALEFKPERWTNVPEAAHAIPSVFSNLFTFIAGPHACIGYRFAVIEMKVLLFTLIRSFEFRLAFPPDDLYIKSYIVSRPFLRSHTGGATMPLYIRAVKRGV